MPRYLTDIWWKRREITADSQDTQPLQVDKGAIFVIAMPRVEIESAPSVCRCDKGNAVAYF